MDSCKIRENAEEEDRHVLKLPLIRSEITQKKKMTCAQMALNKIRENAEEEDRHVLKLTFIGSERTQKKKIDMCTNCPS